MLCVFFKILGYSDRIWNSSNFHSKMKCFGFNNYCPDHYHKRFQIIFILILFYCEFGQTPPVGSVVVTVEPSVAAVQPKESVNITCCATMVRPLECKWF